MVDIISEIKKNGSYATKTEDENQQADDLHNDGMINVASGGSTTVDGVTVNIKICRPTQKFKKLQKAGII